MKLELLRRYRIFMLVMGCGLIFSAFQPETGARAMGLTWTSIVDMMAFLPPIFVLLGLLDVWVERETVMRYMGEGSGLRGGLLAFFLGSAAAGPLYAAFPVAGVLIRKGTRPLNVFIFIGAWSTTKVPLLMFESATLGLRYMLLRLVCNVAGIVAIGLIMDREARRSGGLRIAE